jgi:hypothetical protein
MAIDGPAGVDRVAALVGCKAAKNKQFSGADLVDSGHSSGSDHPDRIGFGE